MKCKRGGDERSNPQLSLWIMKQIAIAATAESCSKHDSELPVVVLPSTLTSVDDKQ